MAVNEFKPDIIMVQEIAWQDGTGEIKIFMDELKRQIGTHYAYVHGDDPVFDPNNSIGPGANAVIYNTNRLSKQEAKIWRAVKGSACNEDGTAQLGVDFLDKAQNKHVVVASMHTPGQCVAENTFRAAVEVDTLEAVRRMTVIGGDLNQRPDTHGEDLENGLEIDPNCWYRRFSPVHSNETLDGESCGIYSSIIDRYYDTAWLSSGGATNPAIAEFCEQFTRIAEFAASSPDLHDAANSCTDIVDKNNNPGSDGLLDKNRIDYIWVSWENSLGTAERPPVAALAATRVAYASADLGVDPHPLDLTNYSDHRAVHALLTWPVDAT